MSENISKTAESTVQAENKKEFSITYVLEQVEKITRQIDYFGTVMEKLSGFQDSNNALTKACLLRDMVNSREATYQQLLCFYQKALDNLKPKKAIDLQHHVFDAVMATLNNSDLPAQEVLEQFGNILDELRHLSNIPQ